ncbi:MAG TPA: hypothetical protein VFU81_16275 [Thermomicrobiales bacterium]|nr:hypothetical protein [Thermomicrobiales bacterium]
MDRSRFDALTRSFVPTPATRRQALRLLLGALVGGAGLASAVDVGARHQRKRKSRCPTERRCGKTCCAKGKICAGGACVIGQGACPAGADSCNFSAYVCGGVGVGPCLCVTTTEGDTRCVQGTASINCGSCTTSDDCAAFGPGAVCVVGGDYCCGSGQNLCLAPCLVGSASAKRMPAGTVLLTPR